MLSSKYQPKKEYPSLVGSLGKETDDFPSVLIVSTKVPPLLSKFIEYSILVEQETNNRLSRTKNFFNVIEFIISPNIKLLYYRYK